MESRVTRTRAKVALSNESATVVAGDAEMAPNVNGNKDGASTDSEVTTKPALDTEKAKDSEASPDAEEVRSQRKRKITDDDAESAAPSGPTASEDESTGETDTESAPPDINAPSPDQCETKPSESQESDSPVPVTATPPVLSKQESTTSTPSLPPQLTPEVQPMSTGNEIYGKGKRARVPNKRYSDIAINTPTRPTKMDSPRSTKKPSLAQPSPASATKNGDFPEEDLGVILREELEQRENKTPRKQPAKTKAKVPDLSKACFRKPFKFGWKREFVHRAIPDADKPVGDIYYISPQGQKIRSIKELAEVLTKHKELVIGDFTFAKAAIGINDPTKEIIRDAKRGGQNAVDAKSKAPSTKSTKKRPSTTPIAPAKGAKSAKPAFKVKMPKSGAGKKEKVDDVEMGLSSPIASSKKGKNNAKQSESKPCRPCSIRCEGALGLVPILQCRICLCLYHHECVGLTSSAPMQSAYVCKNCQLEQGSGSIPPPALSSPEPLPLAAPQSTQDALLANNSLPPQLSPQTIPLPPPPPRHKLNNTTTNNNIEHGKSLVGSLTTWFPPSSTIQVGSHAADSPPRRPQLVEYIGNKKYIVVPRHNVLSVRSPAQADDVPPADEAVVIARTPSPPALLPSAIPPLVVVENPSAQAATPSAPPPSPERQDDRCEESTIDDDDGGKASDEKVESNATTVKQRGEELESTGLLISSAAGPPNFMQNLQYGYTTLFCVFQYLKVQDLLRAGCVCTMWRDMSRSPQLWRTVRMKNSQIHSFDGLAGALKFHATSHLDLRKMLLPANASNDDIWPAFTNAIKTVESLRRIELCRCSATVVEELARNNHQLEVINALSIKCDQMTFEPFANLTNLVDLRLKSTAGLTLTSDLSALSTLTNLKHLSITSIKDLNKLNIEVIAELINLEVLDLGECTDFPKHFGPEILSKLDKLCKLRLEKGQGECNTFDILEAVRDLKEFQQLELVNFDIKTGFDKALGACTNIRKLLIIPTYVSQSATTNHMLLGGVLRLQKSLVHFVWGVTLELLRVTELFVDQCEQPDKKESREKGTSGDSIPVLKPVPLHGIQQPDVPVANDTAQVEILPLPNLQKLLLQNLPTTRVKILKIPFHATWRQSITDSGN